MNPFITFYTPTFRRPKQLARCLESVQVQTAVALVEQIVIVDHIGVGVAGMFAQVPQYTSAVHGRYVTFLCDDDVLASPDVVQQVRDFAEANNFPPLILVRTEKGGRTLPEGAPWPPREGSIDLNCAIIRSDIWKRRANGYSARSRYEGDYDFLDALHKANVSPVSCDLLFSIGAVSKGVAE